MFPPRSACSRGIARAQKTLERMPMPLKVQRFSRRCPLAVQRRASRVKSRFRAVRKIHPLGLRVRVPEPRLPKLGRNLGSAEFARPDDHLQVVCIAPSESTSSESCAKDFPDATQQACVGFQCILQTLSRNNAWCPIMAGADKTEIEASG